MKNPILGSLFFLMALSFAWSWHALGQDQQFARVDPKSVDRLDSAQVTILDTAESRALLGRDDVIFIDNRPSEKFEALGHIPGAFNLPYFVKGHPTNVMTRDLLAAAVGDKIIVFYCTGNERAFHAAVAAMEWGFPPEKIFWYRGGFNAWTRDQKG
ncbi:MAG: rhodanese-like domain-containing protein [Deltaproteobacteria bacterium]|nr:rhodanese-like domain-containing protein [Deltaproteobacteria bacterium]